MAATRVGCVVAGGGVVGLAVARELSRRGRETLLLEAAQSIGSGTSARNSEVVHAGIYYPQGGLKAEMCVEGKLRLYRYAETHGIPHSRCGKLIVATDHSQEAALLQIQQKAAANGVDDLRLMSAAEVRELEPAVFCTAALLSPSTGIVDSHAFMLGLQGDLEDSDGFISVQSPVVGAHKVGDDIVVSVGGEVGMDLHCDTFVNCAGLSASKLAEAVHVGLPTPPITLYAKGNYYALCGKSPFRRLVYPVPEKGTAGLGVHATIDLAGQTRFGPDVEWLSETAGAQISGLSVDEAAYDVDPKRADVFYDAVRKYWPGLADGTLVPDYSGIRPKLSGPGDPAEEFRIDVALSTGGGWGGAVAMYGIESPGLTSSLALANRVADMLRA